MKRWWRKFWNCKEFILKVHDFPSHTLGGLTVYFASTISSKFNILKNFDHIAHENINNLNTVQQYQFYLT